MVTRICMLVLLILFAKTSSTNQKSNLRAILPADPDFQNISLIISEKLNCCTEKSLSYVLKIPWDARNLMNSFQHAFILHIWSLPLLFKISGFLWLVLFGYFLYQHRVRQLEKQHIELVKLGQQRTQELEDKNAILMQNSEDLNEINALLEERQQQIEEQTEEIRINNEWLKMVNDKVKEQAHLMEETNKELVLSNATKDKLFSIIAHDLKGPFSSIMNFSEILYKKSGNLSEEKHLKFIYAIYESSHRVYDLLENLLQWSRMQTHSLGYSPEEFDIKEQIDAIYLLQRSHIDEKKIEFYINIEEDQMVYADRNMLNTVLRNLIGNAIKYTEHGSIHVTVSQQGNNTLFSIEDTGIGIPDTKLAGIFDIDSKKSTTGTKGENGSGLGLIICRDFIQLHGGSISIISQQGRGTIISFALPCQNI